MKRKTNQVLSVAFSLVLLGGMFSSCSKSSTPTPTPPSPINGYSNSDSVASANDIAKWSFDGTLTESKQGLAGTAGPGGVAFTTGVKGQAWQGSSSVAHTATFSAGTAIPHISSYTFSFWMNSDSMKLPQSVATQGDGAQAIFTLVDPTNFWGDVNLFIENRSPADNDTLRLKLLVYNFRTGVVWGGQGPIVRIPGSLKKWIHVALTYSDATGVFTAYVNGTLAGKLEVPYGPASGGSYTQYANDPGGLSNPNSAPIYGAIQFSPVPTQIIIGGQNPGVGSQPWMTNYAGLLDEFRIYNKALTSTEVSSVYQLELAGR